MTQFNRSRWERVSSISIDLPVLRYYCRYPGRPVYRGIALRNNVQHIRRVTLASMGKNSSSTDDERQNESHPRDGVSQYARGQSLTHVPWMDPCTRRRETTRRTSRNRRVQEAPWLRPIRIHYLADTHHTCHATFHRRVRAVGWLRRNDLARSMYRAASWTAPDKHLGMP
jgi:hypothetical protein